MTGSRHIEFLGYLPMVRRYQRQIVRVIVTVVTLVPLAQKEESATLAEYPFVPKVE